MARLVIKDAHGPVVVGDKEICMCGLSKNQPFCDGSHKKTLDEDKETTYFYDGDERKVVAELVCDNEGCCCCGDDKEGSCSCEGKECKCGDDCKCDEEKK